MNADRPKEFDARVVDHIPAMRKLAARYCHPSEREEVVQDTVERALIKCRNFRSEGSFDGWMECLMKQVCTIRKGKRISLMRSGVHVDINDIVLTVRPMQNTIVEARQAAEMSAPSDVLTALALGHSLSDFAAHAGVTRQAARQKASRHRAKYLGVA